MKIAEYFQKDLHHAYVIEGLHEEVLPEIIEMLEKRKIKTSGNPDFCHIEVNTFKIDDARNLKSLSSEKAVTLGKKIFLISANNFLLEAQNTLLKMFEEPIPNTHFFIILPDANALLPTFVSRFYLIKKESNSSSKEAERFLKISLRERIEFLKALTAENDDEEEATLNSSRAKALRFLNSLEALLHKDGVKNPDRIDCFKQIFKARQFLRQPGSSLKSLMESVAITIPVL